MTRQRILCLLPLLWAAGQGEAQRSDLEVSVHGTVLLNGFRNSARVNNFDVPTVALPLALGETRSGLGGSIRQTRLGVTVRHDSILGGRLFAEVDADFFGGQQPSGGGSTHPLLRIRRAFGELRWPGGSLLVGQEAPPLFGTSPVSIASVGFPLFASSGNLWLWLPQIRGTLWANGPNRPVRMGLEVTALAPSTGQPSDPFLLAPNAAELTGRPSFEGRLVASWRQAGRPGELGVGAHVGWVELPGGIRSSRAFGLATIAPVASSFELRGEFFTGRGLAGLGGGGIGQNTTANEADLLPTTGGWLQAIALPGGGWEVALGFGTDRPEQSRLPVPAGRFQNQTFSVGTTWRSAPVVIGFELRRLSTEYRQPTPVTVRNTHLNLGVGLEF